MKDDAQAFLVEDKKAELREAVLLKEKVQSKDSKEVQKS